MTGSRVIHTVKSQRSQEAVRSWPVAAAAQNASSHHSHFSKLVALAAQSIIVAYSNIV